MPRAACNFTVQRLPAYERTAKRPTHNLYRDSLESWAKRLVSKTLQARLVSPQTSHRSSPLNPPPPPPTRAPPSLSSFWNPLSRPPSPPHPPQPAPHPSPRYAFARGSSLPVPPYSYVDVESALSSFLFLLLSLQVHRASSWQRISPRSSAAVVDVL